MVICNQKFNGRIDFDEGLTFWWNFMATSVVSGAHSLASRSQCVQASALYIQMENYTFIDYIEGHDPGEERACRELTVKWPDGKCLLCDVTPIFRAAKRPIVSRLGLEDKSGQWQGPSASLFRLCSVTSHTLAKYRYSPSQWVAITYSILIHGVCVTIPPLHCTNTDFPVYLVPGKATLNNDKMLTVWWQAPPEWSQTGRHFLGGSR